MNESDNHSPSATRLQFELEEETQVRSTDYQQILESLSESQLTPEEALRADRSQTITPKIIERRLSQSIQNETQKENPAPWWKKWLRR
jgi:predicted component of type VI protein secretion system